MWGVEPAVGCAGVSRAGQVGQLQASYPQAVTYRQHTQASSNNIPLRYTGCNIQAAYTGVDMQAAYISCNIQAVTCCCPRRRLSLRVCAWFPLGRALYRYIDSYSRACVHEWLQNILGVVHTDKALQRTEKEALAPHVYGIDQHSSPRYVHHTIDQHLFPFLHVT